MPVSLGALVAAMLKGWAQVVAICLRQKVWRRREANWPGAATIVIIGLCDYVLGKPPM